MTTYHVSKFEMGTFNDGKWYCGCGNPAKWLTSKQDPSKGEKFMRCLKSGEERCQFFLWENDVEEAKASKATEAQQSQRSQTPPSYRERAIYPPTPHSRNDARNVTRMMAFQSPNNASPTPQRYHHFGVNLNNDDTSLFNEVIALLDSGNIELKNATKDQLRYLINMEVDEYESRIHKYKDRVMELSKRLADGEGM